MNFEHLEVQIHGSEDGWITLVLYGSDDVDQARGYCDRLSMSFKVHARIVEKPEDIVVYEKFYNVQDDPDERDWFKDEEDMVISWKEAGF